jgi:hypothetical protein
MDKLHADVTLSTLKLWKVRWDDFSKLNRLHGYPLVEQLAALRMIMNVSEEITTLRRSSQIQHD